MMKLNNGALKSMLINYSIHEPIANFISITAGRVIAWNAAGEAIEISHREAL